MLAAKDARILDVVFPTVEIRSEVETSVALETEEALLVKENALERAVDGVVGVNLVVTTETLILGVDEIARRWRRTPQLHFRRRDDAVSAAVVMNIVVIVILLFGGRGGVNGRHFVGNGNLDGMKIFFGFLFDPRAVVVRRLRG